MEEEIQDKLEEIYELYINVKYKDVNLYEVYVKITDKKAFCIPFLYDKRGTLEANITEIKNRIDRNIVNLFKKVYN